MIGMIDESWKIYKITKPVIIIDVVILVLKW